MGFVHFFKSREPFGVKDRFQLHPERKNPSLKIETGFLIAHGMDAGCAISVNRPAETRSTSLENSKPFPKMEFWRKCFTVKFPR